MYEMTTKQKLLEAALELFSTMGYEATGVDEIAERIGIKGPNLYKYYRGKAALLEAIIAESDRRYTEGMWLARDVVPENGAELKAFTLRQLEYTMNDPRIRKLRKIFTMEQFRDPLFSDRATMYQITNMEKLYSGIFKAMMDRGMVRKADPDTLALEYIAPVTLMIQYSDRKPDHLPYAMERIKGHLDLFISDHFIKGNEGKQE